MTNFTTPSEAEVRAKGIYAYLNQNLIMQLSKVHPETRKTMEENYRKEINIMRIRQGLKEI